MPCGGRATALVSMSPHWSGVSPGHFFELVVEFDPELFSESSVVVPFQRSETTGLSMCMLEGLDFEAKSISADSAYHVTKAIRTRVAPPLRVTAEELGSS